MKCQICKTKINENIIYSNRFFYYCHNCELIFQEKSQKLSENDEKKRYLFHNNTLENTGYINFLNQFINSCVIPFEIKNNLFFDFGSGPNPVLSHLLKKLGYNGFYYDKYFHDNKEYKKYRYGLITCTEVLEHLENPLSYFDQFKKLLLKGGLFAGMTYFHPGNKDLFYNWWYKNDPTHISFYTKKTVSYLADKLKMKILFINDKNMFVLQKN